MTRQTTHANDPIGKHTQIHVVRPDPQSLQPLLTRLILNNLDPLPRLYTLAHCPAHPPSSPPTLLFNLLGDLMVLLRLGSNLPITLLLELYFCHSAWTDQRRRRPGGILEVLLV